MPRLKDEERAFHVSSVIRECVLSLFNFLRCFASRSCELKLLLNMTKLASMAHNVATTRC
jgi:hypothetical protein